MRGRIHRWNAAPLSGPGGAALSLVGPWGTSVPGPTAGTGMILPAGVLRVMCGATASSGSSSSGITIEAYLDGVLKGIMALRPTNPAGQHVALSQLAFSAAVTAGTHYIYFRQTVGNSDSADLGSVFGVVTPF